MAGVQDDRGGRSRRTPVAKTAATPKTTASKAAAPKPVTAPKTAAPKPTAAPKKTAAAPKRTAAAPKTAVPKPPAAATSGPTRSGPTRSGTTQPARSEPKARGASATADRSERWTASEWAAQQAELERQAEELGQEVARAERDWAQLQRDGGDGAGDDQADAGTKTFEREQELSLTANSRELLDQVRRALGRIADRTYGSCENCGQPIGKARLQAFPRATLCVSCKQRQERR